MLCCFNRLNSSPVMTVPNVWRMPCREQCPFVVGSGVADQQIMGNETGGDGSEQLDLFAAHHVRAPLPAIRNAGDDRLAFPRPGQLLGQIVDRGRARHVRRFLPAAIRTDHAGEQQRLVAEPIAYLRNGGGEAALRYRQDALVVLEFVYLLARKSSK